MRHLAASLLALALGSLALGACGSTAIEQSAAGGALDTTCTSDAGCISGLVCIFEDGQCGEGAAGHCVEPGGSDCGGGAPRCDCHGVLHAHACSAAEDGVSYSNDTSCFPPTFPCGSMTCPRGEVCTSGNGPDLFSCAPLPDACKAAPSCKACFGEPAFGCSCTADEYGNLTEGCSG